MQVAPLSRQYPVYAAYVSEFIHDECTNIKCKLDAFDSASLSNILSNLPEADVIKEALATSQYEVLIGNALVNIADDTQQGELVLEITTSWRQVPIDDIVLRSITTLDQAALAAAELLDVWAQHIEANED